MNTAKIIEEVSKTQFKQIIMRYKNNLYLSPHALDHLSDAQRKLFKEDELKNIIIKENSRGIGLQKNGRYSAFYRRKDGFMRIILEIKHPKLEIITYTVTDYMPNLKKLK